jgi:hypothetical protein
MVRNAGARSGPCYREEDSTEIIRLVSIRRAKGSETICQSSLMRQKKEMRAAIERSDEDIDLSHIAEIT